MRNCEFCSAVVDASNKCTGCGAAQSAPLPQPVQTGHLSAHDPNPLENTKPKGSWGCLVALLIVFWPAAIFYYLSKSWK